MCVTVLERTPLLTRDEFELLSGHQGHHAGVPECRTILDSLPSIRLPRQSPEIEDAQLPTTPPCQSLTVNRTAVFIV